MSEGTGRRPALIGLGVVVGAAIVAAIVLRPSPDDVEAIFNDSGAWGAVLFVAAYAVATIAVVPGAPLTIAAGALYGVTLGAALSVVGASIGALAAFLLARRFTGSAAIEPRGRRMAAIERRLSGRGLLALLALRLIPIVPFNALNYAAAASTVGPRDYALATTIGIIPGALLYAALGAGLSNPASVLFIGAAIVAVLLAAITYWRSRAAPPEDDPV